MYFITVPAEKLHFYRLCGRSIYSKVLGETTVHRVATAAFWRTFSDEGKIGGARPPPLFTFTITNKVAVYAPAEWADTLTPFHL